MFINLKKKLNQDNVKYTIIAVLFLHIVFVNKTSKRLLEIYSSLEFRVTMSVIVAYLAFVSPLIAIVLTITYVIILRQKEFSENVDSPSNNNTKNNIYPKDGIKDTIDDIDSVIFNYINYGKDMIFRNKKEESVPKSVAPEERNHPADKTLTDSIQLESNEYRQLDIAQTNSVNSKDEPMSAFKDSLDAQGSNYISGFDKKAYERSRF
jgi:hypothetical protein